MLRDRLIFGPLMIAALLALGFVDDRLDRVAVTGPLFRTLLGRDYLPAGLILLALFILLIILGARELAAIFRAKNIDTSSRILAMAGIGGCTMLYWMPPTLAGPQAAALFATLFVLVFFIALVHHSCIAQRARVQGAVGAGAAAVFCMVYMGLLPGFFLLIRHEHAIWIILLIILTTKGCDIGAYFTGKAIGRHKLIAWLSPAKTWEGLIGGMLVSAVVAVAGAALLNAADLAGYDDASGTFIATPYPLMAAAAAGLLLGLAGQCGDLAASLLKRDAGLKDSGRTIPGFGGLLDVVDSPIAIAPLAYWLLMLARAAA